MILSYAIVNRILNEVRGKTRFFHGKDRVLKLFSLTNGVKRPHPLIKIYDSYDLE